MIGQYPPSGTTHFTSANECPLPHDISRNARRGMNHRICMRCGEPIGEQGDPYFRKPNLCASCSPLPNGVREFSLSSLPDFDDQTLVAVDFHPVTAEPFTAFGRR